MSNGAVAVAPRVTITRVGEDASSILTNLFEHYLHDMAEWFGVETKDDGRYGYDPSLHWNRGDRVFLARVGGSLAGFAIVSTATKWLQAPDQYDMAEFFVIRRHRHSGVAETMATTVWNEFRGRWLVRVFERNAPAVPFWRRIVSTYTGGSYVEENPTIDGKKWVFLRFDNRAVRHGRN